VRKSKCVEFNLDSTIRLHYAVLYLRFTCISFALTKELNSVSRLVLHFMWLAGGKVGDGQLD
jgi:hypothetical protein